MTILRRKITHIETHLQQLYQQEIILREELKRESNLEVQQELTYIQQNIYEQKQVMSQLRIRMEHLTEPQAQPPPINKITQSDIPIIVTEDPKPIVQESVKEKITIQSTKQEFIISQYERRGVENATSFQTVQDELAARFRQKGDENSIERMEQRHRYQKLDGIVFYLFFIYNWNYMIGHPHHI